jgi:hypothetical protein
MNAYEDDKRPFHGVTLLALASGSGSVIQQLQCATSEERL